MFKSNHKGEILIVKSDGSHVFVKPIIIPKGCMTKAAIEGLKRSLSPKPC